MGDGGLFNLVVLLIPLAIFIGRAITHNKRKHAQQQQPPPPPPVQVEEEFEDDDLPHWMRGPKLKEVVEKAIEVIEEKEDANLPHWERAASKRKAKAAKKEEEKVSRYTVSQSTSENIQPFVVAPLDVEEAPKAPPIAAPKIAAPLPVSSRGEANAERPPVFTAPSAPVPTAAAARRGFPNLTHLSPMKQAVIMAEILGPPKGER